MHLSVRFRVTGNSPDEPAQQSQLAGEGEARCSCWTGRKTHQVLCPKADQTWGGPVMKMCFFWVKYNVNPLFSLLSCLIFRPDEEKKKPETQEERLKR